MTAPVKVMIDFTEDGWERQAEERLRTYGQAVLAVVKSMSVDQQGVSYTVEIRCCAPLGFSGDLTLWRLRVPIKGTKKWALMRAKASQTQEQVAARVLSFLHDKRYFPREVVKL